MPILDNTLLSDAEREREAPAPHVFVPPARPEPRATEPDVAEEPDETGATPSTSSELEAQTNREPTASTAQEPASAESETATSAPVDEWAARSQRAVELLERIVEARGGDAFARFGKDNGRGIEGHSLAEWSRMFESGSLAALAANGDDGRRAFDEAEDLILDAAGRVGLLSSNIEDIDNGPVWLQDFGLVKDREDLEAGRAWNAERREEQVDIVRKIDFLKRFSKGDDPSAGFYGMSLDQLRSAALGKGVRNRGDRGAQEDWDDFVKQVNTRYEREREGRGIGQKAADAFRAGFGDIGDMGERLYIIAAYGGDRSANSKFAERMRDVQRDEERRGIYLPATVSSLTDIRKDNLAGDIGAYIIENVCRLAPQTAIQIALAYGTGGAASAAMSGASIAARQAVVRGAVTAVNLATTVALDAADTAGQMVQENDARGRQNLLDWGEWAALGGAYVLADLPSPVFRMAQKAGIGRAARTAGEQAVRDMASRWIYSPGSWGKTMLNAAKETGKNFLGEAITEGPMQQGASYIWNALANGSPGFKSQGEDDFTYGSAFMNILDQAVAAGLSAGAAGVVGSAGTARRQAKTYKHTSEWGKRHDGIEHALLTEMRNAGIDVSFTSLTPAEQELLYTYIRNHTVSRDLDAKVRHLERMRNPGYLAANEFEAELLKDQKKLDRAIANLKFVQTENAKINSDIRNWLNDKTNGDHEAAAAWLEAYTSSRPALSMDDIKADGASTFRADEANETLGAALDEIKKKKASDESAKKMAEFGYDATYPDILPSYGEKDDGKSSHVIRFEENLTDEGKLSVRVWNAADPHRAPSNFCTEFVVGENAENAEDARRKAGEAADMLARWFDALRESDAPVVKAASDHLARNGRQGQTVVLYSSDFEMARELKNAGASQANIEAAVAREQSGQDGITVPLQNGQAIILVNRERNATAADLFATIDHETFHADFVAFVADGMQDKALLKALGVERPEAPEEGADPEKAKEYEKALAAWRKDAKRRLTVAFLGLDVDPKTGKDRDWRSVTDGEIENAEEDLACTASVAAEGIDGRPFSYLTHPFRAARMAIFKARHPELDSRLGSFLAKRFGGDVSDDAKAEFISKVHERGNLFKTEVRDESGNVVGNRDTPSVVRGTDRVALSQDTLELVNRIRSAENDRRQFLEGSDEFVPLLDDRIEKTVDDTWNMMSGKRVLSLDPAKRDAILKERAEREKKATDERRTKQLAEAQQREENLKQIIRQGRRQGEAKARNERNELRERFAGPVRSAAEQRSASEQARLAGIGERDAALGAALEQGRKNAEVDEMNEKANLLGQEQARAALEERDELQRQTEEEDARRRAAQEDVDRAAIDAEEAQELREGVMNARSAELAEDTRRIRREAEERQELSERAGEQELAEREAVAREQMIEEDEREEARQRASDEDEARAALGDEGVRSRGATAEEAAAFDKGPTYHGKTGRYLYKTMRVVNGHLEFPMAGTGVAVPPGEWLIAEDESRIDPKTGKRRTPLVFGSSKIKRDGTVNRQKGEAAPFPGFHMGTNPYMAHIGLGGNASQKHFQNADYVWVAVDVPMARTDEYAQRVATEGKGDPDKAMRGVIPEGGMYWRKTNPNMKGKWGVAGAMKIVKVLSDAEVDEILDRELPDRVRMGRQGGGRFNAKTMQFEGQDLKNWNLEEEEAKFNRAEAIKAVRKALASQFKDDAGNVYPTRYSRHLGRAISKETDDTIDLLSIGVPMTAEEIEARCPEWADAKRAAQKVEADIRDLFGVFPTSEIRTPERVDFNDAVVEAGSSETITKEAAIPGTDVKLTLNEALKRGESYKVRQDRIAVVVIGLPSAGKSSVFVKDVSRALQARVPDNDYVKPVYAEFENGLGGNAVHQESANVNYRILKAARDHGDNIVYPILGYKPEKLQEVLDFFREARYSAHLLYNELPVPKAVARLLTRYLDNGRYLPLEHTIFKAAGKVGPAYEEKKHDFDSYARYSNDVPIGARPKRIEQSDSSILGSIPGYGEVRDGRLGRRPGVPERSGVLEGSGTNVQSPGGSGSASEATGARSRGGSVVPAGRQKQAGVAYPDASAEITKIPDGHFATVRSRGRGEFEEILKKKRPDLDAKETVKNIFALKTPKERKIALHWIVRGGLALPEDAYKVADALSVAEKAKVDPFRYASPDELLLANKDFKPSARPIDPDTEQALTDKRDEGDGITSYLVEESKFGQLTMRRIIDTHWGEDANPWCLLAKKKKWTHVELINDYNAYQEMERWWSELPRDERVRIAGGRADEESVMDADPASEYYVDNVVDNPVSLDDAWTYWQHYSALPKRVAFKDGKLLAFMATDEYDPESDDIFGGELMERTPPGRWREWDEWLRTEEGRENQASFAEWMRVNHPDEYAKALAYEQWWDRTDTSHPNLDWARGSEVRSRGDEGGEVQVGRFGMKPGYDGSLTIETDPDGPDKELHAEIKRMARGLLDILRDDPLPSQVDPKLPPQYVLIAPLYKTDIQNAEQDAAMQKLAGTDYVGRYEEIARLCGTEFDYQSGRGIFQNQREISGRVGLGRVPTDVANLVASLFADVGAVQQQNSAIRYTQIPKEEFDAIENPWEKARVVTLKYDASKFNLQQISDELQDVGFDATPYRNGEVLILKPMGEFYDDDGNYSPEKEEKFEIDFRNAYDILKGKGAIHDFEFEYASENYLDGEARRVLYLARREEERRPALGREDVGRRQGGVGALQEVRPGSSVREDSAEVKSRGGEITPEEDAAYMDAVQRGDMKAAQKMVEDAAKRAFPDSVLIQDGKFRVMWHHTNADFNSFMASVRTSSKLRGIFFTPQEWGSMSNHGNIHKRYYLNVTNPKLAYGYDADKAYVDELAGLQKGVEDRDEIARINREFKDRTGIDAFLDPLNGWYNVLTPEQIKSADPATYDDAGNVIPLSQRFNPESSDVRSRGGDGLFADEIYGLRTRDVVERIKAENPSYVYRPEKRKIVEMVERGFAKAKADPKFYRDTVAAALAGKFSLDTDSQACLMLDEFLRSEAARKARANVIRLRSTGATAEEVAAAQAEADVRAAAHEAVADAYMKFGKALSDGMNQRKAALDPETGSFAGLVQDFEGRAGDGAHTTRDELVAIRRSWDEIRTMRDALRSILDQVADGGADAAIRALMELEAEGIRKSKGAIGRRPTIGEEEKVPSTDDEIAKWAKDRLVGAKYDPNDVETKLALRSIVRKIGRFLLQREMDAGRPLARPEEFRGQLGMLCRRIFSEVDETFNDWSDRTWGDVYSSYGVFTPATKDELARRQTQMTELQRLVSQLQDVEEEQKRPLRTGEQRVESSELAQDLRARIHSLMKELDLPIPEGEDAAKYLKTPLDTVKRAMQRRIDLLQRAIDEHKAVERNLDPVPYDDEALGLKERLEALRTQYELTFPKDEKELTYEERVERLLKGLKNRESKLMAELMDAQQGAFRGRRQDANGLARLNSKVVEARERVAAIREMIGQLEDAAGEKAYYSAESKAIRRLVNAKLRRLSEVNGWIRNPTKWEEQTAKETLDVTDRPQVKAAQAQLDAAIEKWEQVRDQLVWDRQNALSKGLKYAFGLFQVAKRWKAAADLSAVGVQGAVAGFLYDPRIGLDAIWKAVFKRKGEGGYAFSKEACDAIMQHMMDSPRWKVLVEKAGVRISSIDSVDFAKAEELRAEGYAAKRMESLVNKATGGVFGAVTKFGDRTYTMPLDIIRWSFANSLLDQLARVHGGVEAIPEADLKMLGRIVNIESGAGDLFQRLGFAGINRIIWAPGKLAGQLQSLALPVILAANLGKSGGISAKAAMLFFRKCWMRPLAMYGMFLLFYRMLAHLLGDDDHRDEIGEFIDTDPHSPWFGRVNIGGRRFSISAGLESYISLIYRTKDKERSDIYGSTRKVPTASDLITNMLWNKASPDVGIFRQVINGKTIDGRELETAGDKLKFMVGEVFWPLTMHDMYRTATSDTRFMPKLALLGLSAIGYSSNDFDYDSRKLDVSRFDQLTKLTKEDQKVFANKKGEYSAEEVEAARSRMQAYRNDEKYGKYARDYARGLELRERLRAIDNEIKKAEKKYGSNKKGLEADAEYQQLLEYKERTLTAFHRLYTPAFQADLPAFYDRYRPAR